MSLSFPTIVFDILFSNIKILQLIMVRIWLKIVIVWFIMEIFYGWGGGEMGWVLIVMILIFFEF